MAIGNLPNYFLKICFNSIPNLSGGLSSKILLSWIWTTWLSIKSLDTLLLYSYSCSPHIRFCMYIFFINDHSWLPLSPKLHTWQGRTYNKLNILKYTLPVVKKTPDYQKWLSQPSAFHDNLSYDLYRLSKSLQLLQFEVMSSLITRRIIWHWQ